jgi:dihydrofolate reductase
MDPLALVVAVSENGVIGRDGGLPWHLPEDLKHFRRVTTGHAIVMGRRTWESIGRPLPGRRSIVVSRTPGFAPAGAEVAPDLDAALRLARTTDPEPRIIGGERLFAAALPRVTRVHLTRVHRVVAGDTFFPALDPAVWREVERREAEGLTFLVLERQP